jgi:hypothetical protein
MGALTGIVARGNYAGAANDQAAVDILLGLLPNPDATFNVGDTIQSQPGFLDEMSPACLAQLRVELTALRAAVGTTNTL